MQEFFGRSLECWINIQRVDSTSIQLRYSHANWQDEVRVSLSGAGAVQTRTLRGNLAGQVRFDNLEPDTEYTVQVCINDQSIELKRRTLPPEPAEKLFAVGIFSDSHISCKDRADKGRLMKESPLLFADATRQAAENCDILVSSGDLADCAAPEEYDAVEKILKTLPKPFWISPGNHDILNGGGPRLEEFFGPLCWLREYKGVQLASFDTGDGTLDKPCNHQLAEQLSPDKLVMVFSHYQFFADEWIPDADRCIAAPEKCQDILDKLKTLSGVLYIGHKNIASQVAVTDSLLQLNTPQLTQFPAGYLQATVYANEIRHTFEPLASEILNEYSRLGMEFASYKPPAGFTLKAQVRDAYTHEFWNGLIRFGTEV